MANNNNLKRYTEFPALLHLLNKKCISMLDPKTWDDKNDIYYLDRYKDIKAIKTLLALCFTEAPETYHHWKVFAGGTSGVCIIYRREKLLEHLNKVEGLTHGKVEYPTLKEMRKNVLPLERLPFIKRYGFQDEQEYRVVYEYLKESLSVKDIEIPLSCIERITLNPWITESLSSILKDTIRNITDCRNIKLTKSTLVSNIEWKKFANRIRLNNC